MAAIYSTFEIVVLLQAIFCLRVLSADPIVNTTKGQIQGFTKTVNGENVSVFLGVPYAKPPTGNLRFKPPESAENWESNGVLNTTAIKPACPQNTAAVPKAVGPEFTITETNEDCLFLDLYTPARLDNATVDLLPVIVFWHGGGFKIASGSLWDGSPLAVYGNVVVISMNFRLGALGFLSSGDSAAPGNWGLLDQRMALQWIQDNIENFGGDKKRVTIFGHASGAFSVGMHILSPMSRGLFARGVSQGGTVRSQAFLDTNPRVRFKLFATKLKCLSDPDADFSSEKVVECLRKIPVSQLLQQNGAIPGTFLATIDKHFIPDDPIAMWKSGNFPHVDYILGANSDEGTNLAGKIPTFYTGPGLNESEFNKYVTKALPLALKLQTVPKKAISALTAMVSSKYYPKESSPSCFRRSYLDVLGNIVISQIFETAMDYSKKGKVYVFHFTHKPSTSRFPGYVGPGHNEEIRYIFGFTLQNGTEDEKKLSKDWMKTWGEFARTGNPNFNNGSLEWTPCEAPDLSYLEVNTNMTTGNVKTDWHPGIRKFWNEVVPEVAQLIKMTPQTTTPQTTTPQTTTPQTTTPQTTVIKKQNLNWDMSIYQANATMIALIIMSCCLLVLTVILVCVVYRHNRQKSDPVSMDLPQF